MSSLVADLDVSVPDHRCNGKQKGGHSCSVTRYLRRCDGRNASSREDTKDALDIRSTPLIAAYGLGTAAADEEAGTETECVAVVEYLLTLGADVNAVDVNCETAMHGAAYQNLPKMV